MSFTTIRVTEIKIKRERDKKKKEGSQMMPKCLTQATGRMDRDGDTWRRAGLAFGFCFVLGAGGR